MLLSELLEDISRRGFLRGAASAGILGVFSVNAKAAGVDVEDESTLAGFCAGYQTLLHFGKSKSSPASLSDFGESDAHAEYADVLLNLADDRKKARRAFSYFVSKVKDPKQDRAKLIQLGKEACEKHQKLIAAANAEFEKKAEEDKKIGREMESKRAQEEKQKALQAYPNRVIARIKPNIIFLGSLTTPIKADVKLQTDGNGKITGATVHSSNSDFTDAVKRAIDKTQIIPRDVDGTSPSEITLTIFSRD